jgi:hypothetical protein
MDKKIAITSTVFQSLGRRPGIYTVDDLAVEFEEGMIDPESEHLNFIFGQVFTQNEIKKIRTLMSKAGMGKGNINNLLEPVTAKTVHKKNPLNALISPIVKTDSDYSCNLIVPAGNDMVSDHVTGEHISGMVLIEAARQMSMAVIDSRFQDGKKRYQIINELSADFVTFIHPFDTRMTLHFDEFRIKGDKCYIDCKVNMYQADEVRTSIRLTGMAFLIEFARKMEDKSVGRMLRNLGVDQQIRQDVGAVA